MKNLLHCLIGVCCLFPLVRTAHAENGLTRVSDHVFAYVDNQAATPANSFGANAGIIIGDKGIAVVDSLISAKEAQRFIGDIREISDKPIKYVINTHYHLDHSFGNAEFAKLGATIVAHTDCAGEMRQKAAGALANAAAYGLTPEEMAGTELAYPEITFTDRLQLELDGVVAELIYIAPSHSKGSILVYLPGEGAVFTGDILFTDFYPYMGDGDIEGWNKNLDYLATLEANRIIPGHGPLSGKLDVAGMKAFIISFDRKARELAAGSGTLEEMVAEIMKVLPTRKQGEGLIGASLQAKYLKASDNGDH